MTSQLNTKGQHALKENIIRTDLCTGCGACVHLCPYQSNHMDRTVVLHNCDLEQCRGYHFCPRTPVDLDALRRTLFDAADITPDLGAVKEFWVTRAKDEALRKKSQHGGTVTALLEFAMSEGLIDSVITACSGTDMLPEAELTDDACKARGNAGSRFVVSPTVAAFNRLAKGSAARIAAVATPCQALAFAKMRGKPVPTQGDPIDKLKLVIGLFCGWALSWDKLTALLRRHNIRLADITAMDIPPSRYQVLEVRTGDELITIALDSVTDCIRPSCHYCHDLTAEFADLSVGSARLPQGWETARNWNQIIVRSERGRDLVEKARAKGVLEFMQPPPGNLEKLARAAAGKKQKAAANLERAGFTTNRGGCPS